MKRPEITVLAVFAALLLGLTPLAAIATTQQQVNTRESIIETRNTVDQSIENVEDDDESNIPGGYNIRWSTIGEVEGNDGVGVLVADCLPGEIPVMPVYDFVPNVGVTDQQVVGINDHLSLLLVVQNYDNDKQVLSMGVACFDPDGGEDDGEDGDTISIDNSIEITSIVKSIVKNINKNITVIGNGTGGNGSIVIPPPVNNGTDPGTIGNTTTPEITPPVGNTTETETPQQTPPIVENTTTTTPTDPTPTPTPDPTPTPTPDPTPTPTPDPEPEPDPEPDPDPTPDPEPEPDPEPGDDEGDGEGGEPDATDEE